MSAVLTVESLSVVYGGAGRAPTVADIGFSLAAGQMLALVGESGSGKSTIARAVAGIVPTSGGRVLLDGEDMAELRRRKDRTALRRLQMVFQDPDASLNPRFRVEQLIDEPLRLLGVAEPERRRRIGELLDLVRLDESFARRRPAALSGGQKQRVAIARAMAMNPRVLIADEALSALDPETQEAVAAVLRDLCDRQGVAVLFISHDLPMVRLLADSVCVLNRGLIVEQGACRAMFDAPAQPYTRVLMATAFAPEAVLANAHAQALLSDGLPTDPAALAGLADVLEGRSR